MIAPKLFGFVSALALVSACSGERSDELNVSLDSGSELGQGDAGGDDVSADGGPDHTMDGGAQVDQPDASQAGGDGGALGSDAGVPRTDLTVSVQGTSLARCGSVTADVTWQGEPSFPGLTVSGLPAGVSYSVGEPSDGKVSISLSADYRAPLGQKQAVTVTLGEGPSAVSTQAELEMASTFRVTGRVLGNDGQPAAGAQITVNDNLATDPLLSDANGEFVLEDVAGPYDIFIPGVGTQGMEYRGLTRCDPVFANVGAATAHSALLSGTITPPAGDGFVVNTDRVYVGGKALDLAYADRATDVAAAAFEFRPGWMGASTYEGPLHAVLVRPGPVFAAVGSLDLTAPSGAALVTLSIPLTDTLTTRSHTIHFNRGGYDAGNGLNTLSFDVGDGHIDALPVASLPALGALTFDENQAASLTTTIPSGDTVLTAFGRADPGSFVTLHAYHLTPAATLGDTVVAVPGSALLADAQETLDDSGDGSSTFTWGAIPGADAIIVDLGEAVRAVLPGDATSYSTKTVVARGLVPHTCPNSYTITVVFLDGFDPDGDADGSARKVPTEATEFDTGAGRLLGVQKARVYTWQFWNCV